MTMRVRSISDLSLYHDTAGIASDLGPSQDCFACTQGTQRLDGACFRLLPCRFCAVAQRIRVHQIAEFVVLGNPEFSFP